MKKKVKEWLQEWVDRNSTVVYENQFKEISDKWVEIEGVGKFKGC